jgi:Ca-activated chloride channel family protein
MIPRAAALILCVLVAVASLIGQDEPFRISVDVDTVIVDAVVQEQNGRFLADLSQADFEILENGAPQDIVYFAPTATPRSVLLLFDFSLSTDSWRPFMAEAYNLLMKRLRDQDRIAIASFAAQFEMLIDWQDVGRKLPRAEAPRSQAGSDVYWAVDRATEMFKKEKARKAIIVMTDGRDSSILDNVLVFKAIQEVDADKQFQKLVQSVRKQSIPLYFVAMNTDRNRDVDSLGLEYSRIAQSVGQATADRYLVAVRSRMERLADVTGGRIFYPKTLTDIPPLYDALGRDLGFAYSLGYASKNNSSDGKPRRIEVRVRRPDARVTQSRDSYTR